MKRILIVFAKEPRPGKVKTRLKGVLSDSQIIHLYEAFLKDILNTVRSLTSVEKVLAYQSEKEPTYLKKIAPDFRFYKQEGKDLGQRMYNAFAYFNKEGNRKSVLIGSDSPTLALEFIQVAFKELKDKDVVLGPSFDGGYYLIGLKEPLYDFFKEVDWSSPQVFKKTKSNIQKTGKEMFVLPKWYDIDDEESFFYLKNDLGKSQDDGRAVWTRRYLRTL